MELTEDVPLGAMRGSIRAVTKTSSSIRQPALTLCANETRKNARVG